MILCATICGNVNVNVPMLKPIYCQKADFDHTESAVTPAFKLQSFAAKSINLSGLVNLLAAVGLGANNYLIFHFIFSCDEL